MRRSAGTGREALDVLEEVEEGKDRPPITRAISEPLMSAAFSARLRKSDRSSSGSAIRRSHQTKATSAPAPTARDCRTRGSLQPGARRPDDAEHDREQGDRHPERAHAVEPAAGGAADLRGEEPDPEAAHRGDERGGHEAGAPAEPLDDGARGQGAEGDAERREAEEEADRARRLVRREEAHHEGEGERAHGRVRDPVEGPGGRELARGGRERREHRRDDDPAAPVDEHAPSAVGVPEQATQQHEGAEQQLAERHHELHRRRPRVELGAGGAQGERQRAAAHLVGQSGENTGTEGEPASIHGRSLRPTA